MLKELLDVNNQFLKNMKEQNAVLGAWHFGSVSRNTSDELSDIDIVFLIDEKYFHSTDEKLDIMLDEACDEIVLRWAEGFNDEAIKNYGYLIRHNGQLFQYDVFLLNQGKIDDFMCQIHYTELKKSDVIFDKDNNVKALIERAVKGTPWQADRHYLITTYWFHVQMSAKYLLRKDYFKLEAVLRILMDTHTSLLLSVFDKTTWGGSANKLHFIPLEQQKHLMLYGCSCDFKAVRENLLKEFQWFYDDADLLESERKYNHRLANTVIKYWRDKTRNI